MKKKIGLLCCALLVSAGVMAGCFGGEPEIDTSVPPSMTENVTVSTISLPGEIIEEKHKPIESINRTAVHGSITVNYPQLMGLTDASVEDSANAHIKLDADNFAKKYLRDPSQYEPGEMTDTIIHHENTISIVTTGTLVEKAEEVSEVVSDDNDDDSSSDDSKETAIPEKEKTEMVYTTNLSILTGKRISTGVREHAAAMAEMILNGNAMILETDKKLQNEITKYFRDMGQENLTALLKSCDFVTGEGYPKCFSYYMDADSDDIGIYIPVGAELGDYAIVLVNAQSLI